MEELLNPKTKDDCIEFLRLWLGSISVHADGAPVFLIGTHKDKVRTVPEWNKCSSLLRENFKTFKSWGKVKANKEEKLFFFPVDNTQSAKDAGVQNLRTQIEACTKELEFVNAMIPMRWIQVYDQLSRLVEQDNNAKSFVSFQHVVDVAKKCGMPSSKPKRDEVILFFYFHYIYLLFFF